MNRFNRFLIFGAIFSGAFLLLGAKFGHFDNEGKVVVKTNNSIRQEVKKMLPEDCNGKLLEFSEKKPEILLQLLVE